MTVGKDERDQPWAFNINNDAQGIHRRLANGIDSRIFSGVNVMLSVVHIKPNATGTLHSHPEEQWGVLLEGRCIRIQGDEEKAMVPGDFWYTPSGVTHSIRTGPSGATVLDIFSPPRKEYKKAGAGFGVTDVER